MKTAAFSDALTYLDDELISEVRTKRNAVRQPWMGWAAAAACAALVIFAGTQLRPAAPTPVAPETPGTEAVEPVTPEEPGERALIYSWTGGADENACDAAPKIGHCIWSRAVDRALQDDHGQAYLLAFEVVKQGEDVTETDEDGTMRVYHTVTTLSDAEKEAEYRRLAEAGIQLFETPVWEYEGPEGAHRDYTVVTAMVTAEELASFPVNPNYGYGFYFPSNGDSSRPEGGPGDALVLPDW